MLQKQHGGARPGAGRKWKGHVKYERVSFVAPPDLIEAIDQLAKRLHIAKSEAWRLGAHILLEQPVNDIATRVVGKDLGDD